MEQIVLKNICKNYKYYEHNSNLKDVIKNFFLREYKEKEAVKDISFKVSEGEIVGYLGTNGAGKSTTIKMMTGILIPTSGEIRIMGKVPYEERKENSKNIGVVFGQRSQLWWDVPLIESFKLNKYLYKIEDEVFNKRLSDLIAILDMKEFINSPVRQLSLGQRMRGDLCMALLHNPSILFLDEPTIGLDVVVKENIRSLIKEINEKYHTTILLTTHDMGDIEKLCTRVIAIDKGRLIYDGSVDEIKNKYGNEKKIIFKTDDNDKLVGVGDLDGVIDVAIETGEVRISFNSNVINKSQIISEVNRITDIKDIDIIDSDLEKTIARLYEKK